jgi:hypothetical protein
VRFRYRVVVERGVRNVDPHSQRKREREYAVLDERQPKRPREEPIELSSDNDDLHAQPVRRHRTPQIPSPYSVTSDDIANDLNDEFPDDLEETYVEEEAEESILERETAPGGASSSTSADKGKQKENIAIELQEELECAICCTLVLLIRLTVANIMMIPHVCSPCGHGGCGPCGISLVGEHTNESFQMEREIKYMSSMSSKTL